MVLGTSQGGCHSQGTGQGRAVGTALGSARGRMGAILPPHMSGSHARSLCRPRHHITHPSLHHCFSASRHTAGTHAKHSVLVHATRHWHPVQHPSDPDKHCRTLWYGLGMALYGSGDGVLCWRWFNSRSDCLCGPGVAPADQTGQGSCVAGSAAMPKVVPGVLAERPFLRMPPRAPSASSLR